MILFWWMLIYDSKIIHWLIIGLWAAVCFIMLVYLGRIKGAYFEAQSQVFYVPIDWLLLLNYDGQNLVCL